MKRILLSILAIVLIVGAVVALWGYQKLFSDNVADGAAEFIEVPTGSSFDQLVGILRGEGVLEDVRSFEMTAQLMKYDGGTIRAGRFAIDPKASNVALIRHLRGGKQAPVDVVLTGGRMPENVAAKAARFIEPDSVEIEAAMRDTTLLRELGYTPETLMSMLIPNTYELFWNTDAEAFLRRMKKEHDRFWDKENRRAKAAELKLTPAEVYTMASIIEKETNNNGEKKRMAGVYLNRLKIGMLLQADPTSVFATKDFMTRRVTNYHTEFDSPYNTYKYAGLPPGPIAMASIPSIDAVLNAEDHDYLYFVAKGDETGTHNYAKSLAGHNRNIVIYKRNLRKRGIRR